MKRQHVPVRHIDRLNKLDRKLSVEAYRYEDIDPDVFRMVQDASRILSNAIMCINRTDSERVEYMSR